MGRPAWWLGFLLVAPVALSGCFSFGPSYTYDTLATMDHTVGKSLHSMTTDCYDQYGDRKTSGADAFIVNPSDNDIGMLVYVDLFDSEQLTVTVFDSDGNRIYHDTYGDDGKAADFYTITEQLVGTPGIWILEWNISDTIFCDEQQIEILSSDEGSGNVLSTTFTEDQAHHRLKISGSASGWGDEVDIHIIGPDGKVVWSIATANTNEKDMLPPDFSFNVNHGLNEFILSDPPQGKYRLEVEPGDWTGIVSLKVRGAFKV